MPSKRREINTGHSHLLSWFHLFIKMPPFACNFPLENGPNTVLHSPDSPGRGAVRLKPLMVTCFFKTLLRKLPYFLKTLL